MILRFGCENYRSIGSYQEILMTATNSKVEPQHNVFSSDSVRADVLPITAIYGANGSGKTNIIAALRSFIQHTVFNNKRNFEDVNVPVFKLDSDYKEKETSFDIDFILNGKHFHYGYAIKGKKVISEWLYSFSYVNRKSRTVLFHRDIEEDSEYYFNKKAFKGNNTSISNIVNESNLFLTIAAHSKHEVCKEIYNYFKNSYKFRFHASKSEENIAKQIKEHGFEKEISKFLSAIDVGAAKLRVEESEMDSDTYTMRSTLTEALVGAMPQENDDVAQIIRSQFVIDVEHKIIITRYDNHGNEVEFRFQDESLGTRSLISLLVSVFQVLKDGGVFVVDELESSLHTLLSLKVVELFNSKKINANGAQLIFTTHETQLLNFEGFRKDEIWLTEKCLNGRTNISPLSDYSIPRKSNVRNGYLEGRFGAIPFLGLVDTFDKIWGIDE
ncbi:TPA: ATP/GTP-binding protein [Vibrio parahaemolyticus]|uniref:AAA family ATPase n=1 Tax=Vibrio harveyi group TaxID=717610 RepID=UPI001B81FDF9|nr:MULTISPECIES: ATP-binding protein [Vibrio harveyi group]EHR1132700.1 ATP-binding protein [Vibrio parahaemolyticus]EIV1894367.1 ATP-binding protein [Vibrio parahaemolyticus]EIZ1317685.1 ATP-binding protein [Vibrio parahaemolyticus]EKG2485123.1 ATP-binding protein [Vibrio parahaemolyticus]MCS0161403.1 ATP-binding protein [Vibrio alginolyticus]